MDKTHLSGHFGFTLVRATEATALVASRWMGRGVLNEADQAAVRVMRGQLDQMDFSGRVIIGERPQYVDPSILGSGIEIGNGQGVAVDVVVDSIEGVRLLAEGVPDAVSVVAITPRGAMRYPLPVTYMEKIVVGPDAAEVLSATAIDAPPAWTLGVVAAALGKRVHDLTVFVLKRDRHNDLIDNIRATGARVLLRPEGDVVGAILAALPGSGIDMLMGTGGTSQGVMSACAVKALGGKMLTRLSPQDAADREAARAAEVDTSQILTSDDLITSDDIFFAATGITDGLLLHGVRYEARAAVTQSLIIRGRTRTRRYVNTNFHQDFLANLPS